MMQRSLYNHRYRPSIFIVLAILSYPVILWLWRRTFPLPFLAISGDDFHRALYAWEVTQGNVLPSDIWPPFKFWVDALVLSVYPRILSVPALVNLVCATSTLVCLARFGRSIGTSNYGTFTTIVLSATIPWFVWLSLSGLAEPLFFLAISLAYLGVVQWRSIAHERYLWLASSTLLIAGMIRFDGWGHSAVFTIGVLWWWSRSSLKRHRWLVAALLPWLFPAMWLAWHYVTHGSPFYFSAVTRNYWLKVHGYQSLPLLERLLWQPRDLWLIGGLLLPLGLGGLWFARRHPGINMCIAMWLGSLALLIGSTVNYTITQNHPARLVVIHVLLLTPFAALCIQHISQSSRRAFVLAGILIAGITIPRFLVIPFYPSVLQSDMTAIGQHIHELRTNGTLQENDHIMLEVIFWQYVILHVLSDDPGQVLYDREPTMVILPDGTRALDDMTNPSLLALPSDQLNTTLRQSGVRVVIAYSSRAIEHLRPIADATLQSGRFYVFVLN